MVQQSKKQFYEYHLQTGSQIEQLLLKFAKWPRLQNPMRASVTNLWYCLHEVIEEVAHKDPEHPDWPLKSTVIRLMDQKVLEAAYGGGESVLSDAANLITQELLFELQMVCAFLRALPNLTLDDSIDAARVFEEAQKPEERMAVLFRLREAFHDKESRELIRDIALYVVSVDEPLPPIGWYDALVWTLSLQLVYKYLFVLPPSIKTAMLQSYFYHAIIANVPVADVIRAELYETRDPVNYLSHDRDYFDALNANTEFVVTPPGGTKTAIRLLDLFKTVSAMQVPNSVRTFVQEFVTKQFGNRTRGDLYSAWLEEALAIYLGLKEASLIERNSGGEISEDYVFAKDMERLTIAFASKKQWHILADYFKKNDSVVSLGVFLKSFFAVADLKNDEVVNKFVDFNEYLHAHGLMPKNVDLIEFHESDGKFHWNETLFK